MKFRDLLVPAVVLSLSGCAANNTQPQVMPIAVQLRGTAVEVQNFIENRARQKGVFTVDSATDREIVFKTDCMNVPNMGAFKCSLIMMSVGNSGWDGPFAVMTFRTAQVRDIVHLTLDAKWCATNAFGKTNCMQNGSNAENNETLRNIEADYDKKVRPLVAAG